VATSVISIYSPFAFDSLFHILPKQDFGILSKLGAVKNISLKMRSLKAARTQTIHRNRLSWGS